MIMQKLKQNKNVPKTIGDSKIFEGNIAATRGIVKIRWKYVSLLTPPNRHVRAITGNVMRAQRCKMEETWFKQELLKFIGNMCYFWQAGAETVENVTFGEQSRCRKAG